MMAPSSLLLNEKKEECRKMDKSLKCSNSRGGFIGGILKKKVKKE